MPFANAPRPGCKNGITAAIGAILKTSPRFTIIQKKLKK